MQLMSVDIETRSKIDLPKQGVYVYAVDDSTECLCIAYKIDEYDVEIFILGEDATPADFLSAWNDSSVELWAFNANFERLLFQHCICPAIDLPVVPTERWHCSMALCYTYNISGGLGNSAKALGIGERKDGTGHRVMLQLSKPRKPSKDNPDEWFTKDRYPDKFKTLYDYCKQDVVVEHMIHGELELPPPIERELYLLDCKINARGLYVDTKACEKALEIVDTYKDDLKKECKEISGLSPTQRAKLLDWLGTCAGSYMKDLTAESVARVLGYKKISKNARRVLEIRQETSKTSVDKIKAILRTVCKDSRVHGALQYYGATATGRWAGRLIQPQNLKRDTIKGLDYEKLFGLLKTIKPNKFIEVCKKNGHSPIDVLSTSIRGMITPPPKYDMFIADYSAIEARVIAWLAKEDSALGIFNDGLCLYKDMAGTIYNLDDPQEMSDEDPRRTVGKTAILSLGYGVGADKFMNTVNDSLEDLIKAGKHKEMTRGEAAAIVDTYRTKYSNTRTLWYYAENCILKTLKRGNTVVLNDNMKFTYDDFFLHMELPSSRCLRYPSIHTKKVEKWEPGNFVTEIRYRGSRTGAKDKEEMADPEYSMSWRIIPMYGAKFIQNACQAIARDIMAEAMLNAENAGFQIILTVHDEIVAIAPEGTKTVEELCTVMKRVPMWCESLPLEVKGKKVRRYGK